VSEKHKTLDLLGPDADLAQLFMDQVLESDNAAKEFVIQLCEILAGKAELNDYATLGAFEVKRLARGGLESCKTPKHQHWFGVGNVLLFGEKKWLFWSPDQKQQISIVQKAGQLIHFPSGLSSIATTLNTYACRMVPSSHHCRWKVLEEKRRRKRFLSGRGGGVMVCPSSPSLLHLCQYNVWNDKRGTGEEIPSKRL